MSNEEGQGWDGWKLERGGLAHLLASIGNPKEAQLTYLRLRRGVLRPG